MSRQTDLVSQINISKLDFKSSNIAEQLNSLVSQTDSEFISFISRSNHSEVNSAALEKLAGGMRSNPKLALAFGIVQVNDERGYKLEELRAEHSSETLSKGLLTENIFPVSEAVVCRKSAVTEIGGFRQHQEAHTAGDYLYDLWLRLAQRYELEYRAEYMLTTVSTEYEKLVEESRVYRQRRIQNLTGMPSPDLAVYILFLEKVEQTIDCIKSFLPAGIKIYILNNNSSAEARQMLGEFCKDHKQIVIFDSAENLGVGRGRNYMIEHTSEEWLFFVDNDITISQTHWFDLLTRQMAWDSYAEVFLPKLYNVHTDDYDIYYPFSIKSDDSKNTKNAKSTSQVVYSDFVYGSTNRFAGGASVIRRSLFTRLGLYDKGMFVGFEDFELALRGIKEGKPVYARLIDDIELIHNHQVAKTSADKKYLRKRYSVNHLENSYNVIVRKHGIYLPDNYKSWATGKIASLGAVGGLVFVWHKFTHLLKFFRGIFYKALRKIATTLVFKLKFKPRIASAQANFDSNKKTIVFLTPHMGVGGAEKVSLDIASSIDRSRFNLVLVTTETQEGQWEKRFRSEFDLCLVLAEYGALGLIGLNRLLLLNLILMEVSPARVFINNSTLGYESIKYIKETKLPYRTSDIVHASPGGIDVYSHSYIKYLDDRIFISEHLRGIMLSKFYRGDNMQYAKRIRVIRNAVDISGAKRDLVMKQDLPDFMSELEGSIKLLFVGRFSEEKNPIRPLEVLAQLCKEQKGRYSLIMVGDGPLNGEVRNYAENNLYGEKLVFTGALDNMQTLRLIAAADILLLTSSREGMPLVIYEAVAYDTPVVSTDVGGIREIVHDGQEAELVPENPFYLENFVAAVKKITASPESHSRYKQFCRARKEFLDLKHFGKAYSTLFLE